MGSYFDILKNMAESGITVDSCGVAERLYWNCLYSDLCGMSVDDALSVQYRRSKKGPEPGPEPEPEKGLLDIIKEDYAELYAESSGLYYWESHVQLNMKLEEAESVEQLKAVSLENIFEINKVVIQRNHNLITGENTETRVHDTWWNSWAIVPTDFVLTLDEALKIYWESSKKRVKGNMVSMRKPLDPAYKHPFYIFGQQKSFVFVDAVTGEILVQ